MRVVTKANDNRSKPFLRTCAEIWNAVTDRQPKSAMARRFEIAAQKSGVRENVPHQISSMAAKFGLSPQMLQKPDEKARRLLRRCDGCSVAGHCFVDRRGTPSKDAHVSPDRCPNFKEFQNMAREIGSRTAIKNKLI